MITARRHRTLIGAFAFCTAAGMAAAPLAAQETWSWGRQMGAGQTVEIKGVNGAVRAQPSNGSEVRVTAVKTARRGDVSSVRIDVVEHAGGVTICAVYPTPRGRQDNQCTAGSGGRMNVQDNDVQVEFTVHVPRGVNFTGRSVNGLVSAQNLTGDVEARTVNGGIDVVTAGRASGGTVNGAVNVTMGRADWSGALRFETVNGSLTVHLPPGVNTDVNATTVNGSINTDFPLEVRGRFGPRRVSGTIGAGGRTLDLTTVNGAIHIRRHQ